MITLGPTSRARLLGVHPDLVRVVLQAASLATPDEDFTVLEGVRRHDRMCEVYGQGRTVQECLSNGVPAHFAQPALPKVTWLSNPFNSRHRVREDGFGHAVDLAPFPIDWKNIPRFDTLAELMFQAAGIEKVAITWGADWDHDGKPREKGESDSPHFQLREGE